MDKSHCSGCSDDFYNHDNRSMTGECWLLKTAHMTTKFRIGVWTMPLSPGAFTEVRVPNCYRQKGRCYVVSPHPEAVETVRLSNA